MAMRPGPRQPVGSAAWIADERSSALDISRSEVEEFSFSARNDMDWLNEHMAGIFSDDQINVAEIFKTPGKLRGKTPRTARKPNPNETRAPLSDLFSSTPKGAPNPFAMQLHNAQTPRLKIAEDKPASPVKPAVLTRKPVAVAAAAAANPTPMADSGYYGSQSQEGPMDLDEIMEDVEPTQLASPERMLDQPQQADTVIPEPEAVKQPSSNTHSLEETFESAKEDQTRTAKAIASPVAQPEKEPDVVTVPPSSPIRLLQATSPEGSPAKSSTTPNTSPTKPTEPIAQDDCHEPTVEFQATEDDPADVTRSPSDGSSPIRPIVRKSSLNFASLPAREPLTSNKSLGARMSRTSHLDQTRTSYYNRNTGGKSLGVRHDSSEDDQNDVDMDEDVNTGNDATESTIATHSKTYTQRLQDQISMLGKSQPSGTRPSKSIPNLAGTQQTPFSSYAQQPQTAPQASEEESSSSPPKVLQAPVTPGAFPRDDEDDWIAPPTVTQKIAPSSRPAVAKSFSTDLADGVHGKETVSGSDFVLPNQRQQEIASKSPARPLIPERTTSAPAHSKPASDPSFSDSIFDEDDGAHDMRPKKTVSVSNPTLPTVRESGLPEPPKSPSRNFRGSPLKHVKDKFSSILKSSKGLLASSAAISAEGKAYLVSPSATRVALYPSLSTESLQTGTDSEPLYPDLTKYTSSDTQPSANSPSPGRQNNRKTRASAEREKRELKQKDKVTKEAQRQADQMDKLEKAREKEREKARIFSEEQEKTVAMEKQVAAQKEQEKPSRAPPPKETPRPTRTSPRKAKPTGEAEGKATAALPEHRPDDDDVEMIDAASAMPPPTIPRSATDSQAPKPREIRRPTKPTKEASTAKHKQAPTLIRVNTSSQHGGFHPSNSVLAASLQETLGDPQPQVKNRSTQQTVQSKPSLQSLKSSVSSSGRPKALELAAKRKEQEEREAQRKRDAKAEMERKRAAMQEEERRQEQQRRQEAEKQKEREREQAAARAEAKKHAQHQAAIEKAKQTRAPPPAVRSQPNGPPDYGATHGKSSVPRPQSRLPSSIHRSQEDLHRPVNALLSNTAKTLPKRPLQQDANDDANQRSTMARSGPSHQQEAKRMRMTDEFDFDDELEFLPPPQSNIKGPPVRPSGGFKKDMTTKSMYAGAGYTPAAQGMTRDLFKATVTAQHNTQTKVGHPLDMAQVSKGAIPFAPNSNAASHKTPSRPAGATSKSIAKSVMKSATRQSPRFQNGDAIELPEIQTDDEDDEDEGHIGVAPWADSPDLRRALMQQETIDPLQIFGPPGPLNMEEVFHKSKDRWHKFRARTSSANWSGTDRLTEEDIRKDLAARDKMRREGGWSYELSKDVA